MSQHDYVIANDTGANVRADINNALLAISSNNSGSSEPSTSYAYEWWIDTSNNLLKLRNAANNAWISLPIDITASNTTPDSIDVGVAEAGDRKVTINSAGTPFGSIEALNSGTKIKVTSGNTGSAGCSMEFYTAASDGTETLAFTLGTDQSATFAGVVSVATRIEPDASDGADLGSATKEWSDLYLADEAIIYLGDDQDVQLSHVQDTGLQLNGTNKLMFNDATQFVQGSSATVLSLGATDEIDLTATAVDVNGTVDLSSTVVVNGNATFKAGTLLEQGTLTESGSAVAWDVGASPVAKLTLTASTWTLSAPTNVVGTGQFISILILQDGTGSRTLAWNGIYEFTSDTAPTLSTAASVGDVFTFFYNGSKWLEVARSLNLTQS